MPAHGELGVKPRIESVGKRVMTETRVIINRKGVQQGDGLFRKRACGVISARNFGPKRRHESLPPFGLLRLVGAGIAYGHERFANPKGFFAQAGVSSFDERDPLE